MATILVTGGAGYIGSHICKALHLSGHTPVTLDNLSRGFAQAVKWGPLVKLDLRDRGPIQKIMTKFDIQGVIHLAAYAYAAESTEHPEMYFENNVGGMAQLLSAMQESDIKNIVFSSSCATYGEAQEDRIKETHPQNPINPYGLSKLMGERMLIHFKELFEFNICGLRYFNVAGADPEGEIGENHTPEPHLIPTLLDKLTKGESFQINGNNYPTKDGTCVRDFVHVVDLAHAHVLAMEKLLNGKLDHDFYNIGLGQGHSLLEVAEAMRQLTKQKWEVQIKPPRNGDVAYLVSDPNRFQLEMNWEPQHSELSTIIQTAHNWHKITKETR
jgi:UDP-glucose-4-epimerase GalE